MKTMLRTALLAGSMFFTACAGISVQEPVDTVRAMEARKLLVSLESGNQGLERFKGTGRFRIRQADKRLSARVAWVGSYPDKLRIAVLNPGGQPVASLATDGRFLYMLSYREKEFYKKRTTNPTLQKLVSVPISVNDIIAILTGRLPLREHDLAELTADEEYPGYILVLKSRWRGVVEKIYLDIQKREVFRIEMFGLSGHLLYRADFYGKRQVDGYRLPQRVVVSDADESRFELDIENYWTDVSLKPSTFVLTPP